MTTTIDSAGRIVIPSAIRTEAGLLAGTTVDIRIRDGVVEIEPAARSVTIVKKGKLYVAVPTEPSDPLSAETVAHVREKVRSAK